MLKRAVVLVILCFSCCTFAQTINAIPVESGAILPKPGPATILPGDTAGWMSVESDNVAKPGSSLDKQCQMAIHGTDPLMSYRAGDSEIEQLVPIISSGGIDVYATDSSFGASVRETRYGGFFSADLFLVFRDEAVRQRAIQAIYANNLNVMHPPLNLKYVWMRVAYYPKIYFGSNSIAGSGTIQGPVLDVGESDYIAPVDCTTAASFFHDLSKRFGITGNVELIITPKPMVSMRPTLIGSEHGFDNGCTNCSNWSLLAGDLTPLRTAGGMNIIRVDKKHSPFLVQIIDAMEQRIAAARQSPRSNDQAK